MTHSATRQTQPRVTMIKIQDCGAGLRASENDLVDHRPDANPSED